ncbi:MAG: hypothetical protein WCL71_03005 [Deltaproteobacteria bacterium]
MAEKKKNAHEIIEDATNSAVKIIKNDTGEAINSVRRTKQDILDRILSPRLLALLLKAVVLLLALWVYTKLPSIVATTDPTKWKQVVLAVVPQLIFGAICVAFLITNRSDDA